MSQFIGHLHPLVVHLPIGFILLAIISDGYLSRKGQDSHYGLSTFLWLLSSLSAIAAVITGLILVDSGHYEGLNIFLHRWSAIVIAILSTVIFVIKWRKLALFQNQGLILNSLCIFLLLFAGHKGGQITHGSDFLPIPFVKASATATFSLDNMDSVRIYDNILRPVFDAKCTRCHEKGDERGRLNLETSESLLSDVFGDPGIMPGNVNKSEIFKRVTLKKEDEKFMPPSGTELTYSEIRILEFWISSGASFTDILTPETEIPQDVKNILSNNYGINFEEKSFYDRLIVDQAEEASIDNVKKADFSVRSIAAKNPLLDVSRVGHDYNVSSGQIEKLLLIKDQITWLDLSNTSLPTDIGNVLSQMPNLTKLKLQNTEVGDELVNSLLRLEHIQMLNLYNTNITDTGFMEFGKIPSLKSIYIWQTKVSEGAVEELKSSRSDLSIVGNESMNAVPD